MELLIKKMCTSLSVFLERLSEEIFMRDEGDEEFFERKIWLIYL